MSRPARVTTKQRFKGKLPCTLETTSKIVRYDPPTHFQVEGLEPYKRRRTS